MVNLPRRGFFQDVLDQFVLVACNRGQQLLDRWIRHGRSRGDLNSLNRSIVVKHAQREAAVALFGKCGKCLVNRSEEQLAREVVSLRTRELDELFRQLIL